MKPFVDDMKETLRSGIKVNDNLVNVKIRCFVCDTPARCFLKGLFSVLLHITRAINDMNLKKNSNLNIFRCHII